ncbi:MAG: pyridoxine 5'-phosphate synthase, partial [Desulfuromonadales bacterium]
SRASMSRPFTRVREMQAAAQKKYQDEIQKLEASLSETQRKLNELQANKKDAQQKFILSKEQQQELENIDTAIKLARKVGMGVNAGHGLNYTNIKAITALGGIEEYNIGHSIIARAMLVGLDRAVRDMVELLKYA